MPAMIRVNAFQAFYGEDEFEPQSFLQFWQMHQTGRCSAGADSVRGISSRRHHDANYGGMNLSQELATDVTLAIDELDGASLTHLGHA